MQNFGFVFLFCELTKIVLDNSFSKKAIIILCSISSDPLPEVFLLVCQAMADFTLTFDRHN